VKHVNKDKVAYVETMINNNQQNETNQKDHVLY